MGNCSSCGSDGHCSSEQKSSCSASLAPHGKINRVIGVMSGKGGVGKSTITALLANGLAKEGYKVGVLDADITGPSIPRLLGVANQRMQTNGTQMLPVVTGAGIKAVSLNLILEQEDSPVIWRGPIVTNTVLQFWKDVLWGDLDFLLIDLPPGTSDVTLTVLQSIPVSGMVMVSLPQDMVEMIVGKAIKMVQKMECPILGVVENMSFLLCPDCQKRIPLFNSEKSGSYLQGLGVELLAQLPMSLSLSAFSSEGVIEGNEEVLEAIESLQRQILKKVVPC